MTQKIMRRTRNERLSRAAGVDELHHERAQFARGFARTVQSWTTEMSGAISSGLDQVLAYRDAKQAYADKKVADVKAAEADKSKASLDALDNEISKLEKQKKIELLKSEGSSDANLTDIKSETARIEAQIALLLARKKLQDAEKALTTP